jgi:hypothetical protein
LMRLVDWFLALGLGQKIVVGVALATVLFLATLVTYLASLLILSSAGVGPPEAPPSQQSATPAPASLRPGGSASVSSEPDYDLKRAGKARWPWSKGRGEGTSPRYTATSSRGIIRGRPSTGGTARSPRRCLFQTGPSHRISCGPGGPQGSNRPRRRVLDEVLGLLLRGLGGLGRYRGRGDAPGQMTPEPVDRRGVLA